jgi:hypothetical protein
LDTDQEEVMVRFDLDIPIHKDLMLEMDGMEEMGIFIMK